MNPLDAFPQLEKAIGNYDWAGGAEGIRTPDPHNAIVVLYQLSYDPRVRATKITRFDQDRLYFFNVTDLMFATIGKGQA